jgi:hypothetical protein
MRLEQEVFGGCNPCLPGHQPSVAALSSRCRVPVPARPPRRAVKDLRRPGQGRQLCCWGSPRSPCFVCGPALRFSPRSAPRCPPCPASAGRPIVARPLSGPRTWARSWARGPTASVPLLRAGVRGPVGRPPLSALGQGSAATMGIQRYHVVACSATAGPRRCGSYLVGHTSVHPTDRSLRIMVVARHPLKVERRVRHLGACMLPLTALRPALHMPGVALAPFQWRSCPNSLFSQPAILRVVRRRALAPVLGNTISASDPPLRTQLGPSGQLFWPQRPCG